ncbi:MAG: hypothetical protein JWN60_63 [Acidobacteria bacterium]|nr:hypothetical protein [Acidobacteriota bacterium]
MLSFINIFAQDQEARKFEELNDFCCEMTRDVFDRFFREIQNNPEAKGYIIFYEGKNNPICSVDRIPQRGEIDLTINIFKNHISLRGQNPKRFSWIKGGYREYWTAEFWIVPSGANAPKPTPTLVQKNIKFKKGKAKRLNLHCEP